MYVYKYSVDVYLLCMIKVRVRWYTCSLWRMLQPLVNCCWSVSPSSSFLLTCIKTTTRNELARLGMGTIFLVGERAKRARRYLVMFMETRVLYVRLFLIRMRALVFCELNSREETEDFLAWAVKVPVDVTVNVAFSCLLFASFVLLQVLQQTCPGLLAASMQRISIGLLLIRKYNIFC